MHLLLPLFLPLALAHSTTVDVLSSDPELSHFLHHLQRARLIPALNSLSASTIFAPTNAFFPLDQPPPDNILHELRQTIWYHILNYTLPSSLDFPASPSPPVNLESMLYPNDRGPKTTPDAPPADPWIPRPVGQLGTDGQRLRAVRREGEDWVGVDWAGNGGVRLMDRLEAGNGVVWKVDGFVHMPSDIGPSSPLPLPTSSMCAC